MDFKRSYKRQNYLLFFKNQLLPEDFEIHEEKIQIGFQTEFIKNVTLLGKSPSLELGIYEAEHTSENDPRVSISRESFRLLAQYGVKRALILFTSPTSSNYRLSLVTIDLKWEEGSRVQKEYSNPRRYSFFLGPDTKVHTPEEYLVKLGRIKDFEDLKKRFSIEVVNKDFYTEIAARFTKLAGGKRQIGRKSLDAGSGCLKLPSVIDDTVRKEFAVRLIGRLVFCWFLKKKHSDKGLSLLPEELLSSKAVKDNYYHNVLEPLFFQVLNTHISERLDDYCQKPWSIIPFLNGGLFTPHLHDFYKPGTLGISVHINTLKVPDGWFKELFDIFETYNFTIDENTSVDVELSIEPEMLGRIFENLLAEINPETGETARKATGSYYTPRPIVEYMVDESLKQYLLTKTKITESKIISLLSYEDEDTGLTDSETESVIDALDTIKIIDPACGSGAFPMGILQKMLLVLQKVDPNSQKWLAKKISKNENGLLKRDLEAKLKSENFNYIHKLGIIQSSIYGVDIQPIAIDISKLRFFLSLIVDEEVNDSKVNRGVKHLPNLEFKFVCANSLIGLPSKVKVPTGKSIKKQSSILKEPEQLDWFEAADDIDKLKGLREEYLQSYGKRKKDIEKEFSKIQNSMFEHSIKWGAHDSQTYQLSTWEPFLDKPCAWFDPEWMFGVKDGFDVVIANPPYVFTRKMDFSAEFKKYVFENYFVGLKRKSSSRANQSGKINLFGLFIMKAVQIANADGLITYITPNTILRTTTYDIIRKYILDNTFLLQILDLGGGVFDAVTASTDILILQKQGKNKKQNAYAITNIKNIESKDYHVREIEPECFYNNVSYTFNIFVDDNAAKILYKVSNKKHALGDLCKDIIEGIVAHKHLITNPNPAIN